MKKTFIFSAFFIFIIFSSVSFAFEPSSNTIYNGIDVSQWQRNINFSDVADDNIYIVYIKATQGNNYIDPYFEKNYANAKKNNFQEISTPICCLSPDTFIIVLRKLLQKCKLNNTYYEKNYHYSHSSNAHDNSNGTENNMCVDRKDRPRDAGGA